MKKSVQIIIILVIIISIFIYGIYWAFFDIQRIDGQEVLKEISSPNKLYTITAYLNNGGATTDYAVLCMVTNNETGKKRNIYWQYHCSDVEISWLNEKSVIINGVELDVLKDYYDYRRN